MRAPWKTAAVAALALAAVLADVDLGAIRLPAAANAIIGRPATPVSYAGAARRTVRRGGVYAPVAVTTVAVTASRPPPPPGSSVPIGTIVVALPAGCVSTPLGGVNYFDCRGVYYRPAFQSNTLVYVVSQP